MRTAQELFSLGGTVGESIPGQKVNSKTISVGFNRTNFNYGGNRLSGAWHTQFVTEGDNRKVTTLTAKPTSRKIGARGVTGAVGQFVPFNNTNTRPLAGSAVATGHERLSKGANTLRNQHMTRTTARGIAGANTTTRRGGGSQKYALKPVAGTVSTFALPGPTAGRGGTQLVQVKSSYNIGFHKVIVTKNVKHSFTRPVGEV